MPVTFSRDDGRKLIRVTASAAVTRDELASFIDRQHQDGLWEYAVLFDARTARPLLTPTDLMALVHHVRRVGHGARRGPVAVVTNSPLHTAIVKMYATLSQLAGRPVDVFHDIADAERWIDQDVARPGKLRSS